MRSELFRNIYGKLTQTFCSVLVHELNGIAINSTISMGLNARLFKKYVSFVFSLQSHIQPCQLMLAKCTRYKQTVGYGAPVNDLHQHAVSVET